MKTRLREAGRAFKRAPEELRDAILEAADDDATSLEIAQECEFAYSPDYISKVIQRYRPNRKPGRRPGPRKR